VLPGALRAAPQAEGRLLGYESPVAPFALLGCLVLVAALVNRFAPKAKRRVRRATILFALYTTCFLLAALLHKLGPEFWSHRLWLLADLFGVLVVVDLAGIAVFELALAALKIEVADIVTDLVIFFAYLLAALGLMHRSGFDLSSIVATSAVVTAVLGLSLQATLANVLGGIALQLDDTIDVGDWVQLRDGTQGKVKAIRWRSTILETRNWDTLVVPNTQLLGEQILVLGEREDQPRQHRMWVWFHVDFRYSPELVIETVNEGLQAGPIPRVAPTPAPHAICCDLSGQNGGGGVATYAVRYWLTELAADDPTSSEIRVRIFAALRRAGIPLAVPAHAVFLSQDDEQHKGRKAERELHDRVAALESIEMLQCLSQRERRMLAQSMRLAPFGRGEIITRQGAQAHWLYILAKGEVEVRLRWEVPGEGGAPARTVEKVVNTLRAPDIFGEMGVMTGEPRTASITALTEVDCFRIPREAFRELLKVRKELAESMSEVMARRRVQLDDVRLNLGAGEQTSRVALETTRILEGIQRFFGLDEGGKE
jgi:small-conductance mechanosensitive channel/CRP-like cAMP-binding protein